MKILFYFIKFSFMSLIFLSPLCLASPMYITVQGGQLTGMGDNNNTLSFVVMVDNERPGTHTDEYGTVIEYGDIDTDGSKLDVIYAELISYNIQYGWDYVDPTFPFSPIIKTCSSVGGADRELNFAGLAGEGLTGPDADSLRIKENGLYLNICSDKYTGFWLDPTNPEFWLDATHSTWLGYLTFGVYDTVNNVWVTTGSSNAMAVSISETIPTPEPSTIILISFGLIGYLFHKRNRRVGSSNYL